MKKHINIILSIALINLALIGFTQNCVQCSGTSATGETASAIGINTTASGKASFAGGMDSEAIGRYSLAFGDSAKAWSRNGIALGKQVSIFGAYSFGVGENVKTTTTSSMIIGSGFDDYHPLENGENKSLMIGFNSSKPTFFVKGAIGDGYTGKIGIGNVTDPQAKLHIKGDADNGGNPENADILLEPGSSATYARIKFGTTGNTIEAKGSQDLNFYTASDFVFWNANVGIGINNPSEKLDVSGTIKSTGLKLVNGTQAAGKILQSDADGNATWVNMPETGDDDWIINGSNIYHTYGKVGIGTSNPQKTLDVNGSVMVKDYIYCNTNQLHRLMILGGLSSNSAKIELWDGVPNSSIKLVAKTGGSIQFFAKGDLRMSVNENYVEIGKPSSKIGLRTHGKIDAEEIEVHVLGWSDFVFDKDYKLSPLSEVEQYIKEHGHLPDIPSESEVKQNGIDLAEMNALLLQKIEELTLYVIELEKKIEK